MDWRIVKKSKLKKSKTPIRAISIQQPYVEEILRGVKRYEYRSRRTHIREKVYLYASQTQGAQDRFEDLGLEPGDLPTGVIVGTVDIVNCKYFPRSDEYGYELKNPKRLKRVRTPKGKPQPCWFYPFKKKAA